MADQDVEDVVAAVKKIMVAVFGNDFGGPFLSQYSCCGGLRLDRAAPMANCRKAGSAATAAVDPGGGKNFDGDRRAGDRGFPDLVPRWLLLDPDSFYLHSSAFTSSMPSKRCVRTPDSSSRSPLSHCSMEWANSAAKQASANRVVQVGYICVFTPAIRTLKKLIDNGVAGRDLVGTGGGWQYLPDWRAVAGLAGTKLYPRRRARRRHHSRCFARN